MNMSAGIRQAELAAPADVLRDVAHELRQPLSTIESIAYYLGMVLPDSDERAHAQVAMIRQLVEQSNWILTSGVGLASGTPATARTAVDLDELITQAAASVTGPERSSLRLALAGDMPLIDLDAAQGRELAECLVMLARQLSVGGEASLSTGAPACGGAEILVSGSGDNGLSAFGPGWTLGIENARRIVENHGGTLVLEATPEAGIRLRVMLP